MRRAQRYPYPWVEIDNQLGARRATEYLLSLGHTRIALVGTEQLQDDPLICTDDRLQGYRSALKTARVPYDPALFIPSALTEDEGYQVAQQLLALPDPPTAVFAADIVAAGVIHAAQDVGKLVGRHFSVVGCDGLDLGRVLRPSLTTLSLPFARIGQRLVTLLVHQVRGEEIEEKHIIVEPELIVRDSTTLT
jgi:LacI family transcriptional regulator